MKNMERTDSCVFAPDCCHASYTSYMRSFVLVVCHATSRCQVSVIFYLILLRVQTQLCQHQRIGMHRNPAELRKLKA